MSMKTKTRKGGFTLIELLLVIAIIGILAGAVFALMGNGDNARRKAILSTAKSIMPYAQECLFKGDSLSGPTDTQSGGGLICSGSVTPWPAIGVDDCNYSIDTSDYSIVCAASVMDDPRQIICDVSAGSCLEANTPTP